MELQQTQSLSARRVLKHTHTLKKEKRSVSLFRKENEKKGKKGKKRLSFFFPPGHTTRLKWHSESLDLSSLVEEPQSSRCSDSNALGERRWRVVAVMDGGSAAAPAAATDEKRRHEDALAAADDVPLLSSSLSPPLSCRPPRASLGIEVEGEEPEEDLATARRCLYASHLLSAWGARAWEFAAGLALFFPPTSGGNGDGDEKGNSSLSLVAALGLAQQAAQAFAGPFLGKEVDRLPRLVAAERAYALQAGGTMASALFVLTARRRAKKVSSSPVFVYLLGSLAALFAALAAVGASGATLSVEKEWTRALAKEGRRRSKRRRRRRKRSSLGSSGENAEESETSSSALLASINATMRRIDLACLLASPAVAGVLLEARGGAEGAVSVIALFGVCAWLPQRWLLRRAVAAAPSRLAQEEEEEEKEEGEGGEEEREGRDGAGTGEEATANLPPPPSASPSPSPSPPSPSPSPSPSFSSPLAAYLSAEALPSALALALLYLTVLSFGPLATAYLNWRGLRETELAFWRGLGAASGLAATAVFPVLARSRKKKKMGPEAAGLLGIGSQLLCLLLGCAVAFGGGGGGRRNGGGRDEKEVGGARFLAASLALSRFGLWLFDLSASQQLQERVPAEQLGAINGVQGALQAGLGAASFAAGLFVHRPASFGKLAAGSLGSVCLALFVCIGGSLRFRKREEGRLEREGEARREIAAATAAATANDGLNGQS